MVRGSRAGAVAGADGPISGREGELAELRAAIAGPGPGAMVSGPAWIGLTTLLRLMAAEADPERVHVVEVRGDPALAGTELAAFAHLAAPMPAPGASLAARMSAVLATVREQAQGRETLLLLDDAEALDPASVALACQLADSGAGTLIAAFHLSSPATGPLERLWRAGKIALVEPQPLGAAQVTEVVEAMLGGTLALPAANHILSSTGGRPGLLRPLVRDALETGALTENLGMWICEKHDFELPAVSRLAYARLAEEEPGVRRVAQSVSLAGFVPVAVLDGLWGRDAVVAAEERGWVRCGPDGRVRPEVAAIAAAIAQALAAAEARSLRSQIVREWRSIGGLEPGDELQIVLLARHSDLPPSPGQLSRAAHIAASQFQSELAGELAASALAGCPGRSAPPAGPGGPGPSLQRSQHLITELAPRPTSDGARVAALHQEFTHLLWENGDAGSAERLISSAMGTVREPGAIGELNALRSTAAALGWKMREAREWMAQALAGPASDFAIALSGESALAVFMATASLVPGAPTVADVESALDRRPDLLTALSAWFGHQGVVGLIRCDASGLACLTERWLAREPEGTSQSSVALTSTLRGSHELVSGRATTATHHYVQALALLADEAPAVWRERSRARLALAHAMGGERKEASGLLGQLDPDVGDPGHVVEILTRAAQYWINATAGHVDQAIQLALEDAARYRSLGVTGFETVALHYAIRFGDTTGRERIAEIAASHDSPRARIAAQLARGLDGERAEDLKAGARAAAKDKVMLAALDLQSRAAAALAAGGPSASFWQALAQARRMREECEADTPAWLAVRQPLPLTPRELEVARLVAAGMSNVEVARRLVLSTRTAEGHLQRVFDKLGLHDRAELQAVISAADGDWQAATAGAAGQGMAP